MQEKFSDTWHDLMKSTIGEAKIVLAVSGGLDSMVLLNLLMNNPEISNSQLVVAHFNHQLRFASQEEAVFVKAFCQKKNLTYHYGQWTDNQSESNVEKRARVARYHFLEKICLKEDSPFLITGHHQDDLAETVLMKLVSGSRFANLVGIQPVSQRADITLIRPLLNISKQELLEYSMVNQVSFMEDESNQNLNFKRNRYRQNILPLLKAENPNLLEQIDKFTSQVHLAAEVIEKSIAQQSWRMQSIQGGWSLDLAGVTDLNQGEKYFLLDDFFQKTVIAIGVPINNQQHQEALSLLNKPVSYAEITLANGWRLVKSYEHLELINKPNDQEYFEPVELRLGKNDLANNRGQLLLEESTEADPECASNNQQIVLKLSLHEGQLPLVVREVLSGDALVFNKHGQHKKINRLFIDRKIPREKRKNYLVLVDNNNEILSLFSTEESYLSITKETDRIHYRLTYFVEK